MGPQRKSHAQKNNLAALGLNQASDDPEKQNHHVIFFQKVPLGFHDMTFNSLAITAEVFELIFKTNLFLQLAELQEFW